MIRKLLTGVMLSLTGSVADFWAREVIGVEDAHSLNEVGLVDARRGKAQPRTMVGLKDDDGRLRRVGENAVDCSLDLSGQEGCLGAVAALVIFAIAVIALEELTVGEEIPLTPLTDIFAELAEDKRRMR